MFERKHHWFSIRISYMSKGGRELYHDDVAVPLNKMSEIFSNPRRVRLICAPTIIASKDFPKWNLCNGYFNYVPLAYLGKFAAPKEKK